MKYEYTIRLASPVHSFLLALLASDGHCDVALQPNGKIVKATHYSKDDDISKMKWLKIVDNWEYVGVVSEIFTNDLFWANALAKGYNGVVIEEDVEV